MDYELIVVGAGPAGLSAALTAAYFKLKTLVIESASAGGALANKYPWKKVYNYLGLVDMTGAEVAAKMVEHVRAEGVRINENEVVTDIKRENSYLIVFTNKREYTSKSVILAIGLSIPKRLGIEGESLEGVIHSLPDPKKYRGKKVLVVGGGDTAVEYALALQSNKAETTIIHRRDTFRTSEENKKKIENSGIEILYNTEIKEILGNKNVEKASLINNKTGWEEIRFFDVILFCLGTTPNTEFLQKIGIKMDEKNNIVIDNNARTNIEGIFAAGDIVGRWRRIPEAIGEGGFAAINAFKYMKNPYWA